MYTSHALAMGRNAREGGMEEDGWRALNGNGMALTVPGGAGSATP